MTVDWSEWMEASPERQQEMLKLYREKVRCEAEANAARWARMTPAQRARYPEL